MINVINLDDINAEMINLTGVRLLILFALLLESPKSKDEIISYFEKINYPKNCFSTDTMRNDMNALRIAGCKITRADKSNNYKYTLISHPFELKINLNIAKKLSKLYIKHHDKLNMQQLLYLERLFNSLSQYTTDYSSYEYLKGISLIKNINKPLLEDLYNAYKNSQKITFWYNSPNNNKEQISFIIDNFEFRSKKLYISGYSFTHKNSAFFPIARIIPPIEIHKQNTLIKTFIKTVICEISGYSMNNYCPNDNEKIIKKTPNKIVVKIQNDNDFKLIQQLLSYGPDVKILSNNDIKQTYLEKLKKMQRVYQDD